MKHLLILIFFGILGCVSEDSKKPYTRHFEEWINDNNYNFDEYIVLEFNSCHYCHDQVVKFIQNGYLSKIEQKAFVLVISDKSEKFPIRDYLNSPNLLIYNLQKEISPILSMSPRIYSKQDSGEIDFEILNSETLTQKIEKIVYSITTNTMIRIDTERIIGIPIPGNENFIAYTDSSNFIYYVENFEIYYDSEN